MIKDLKDLQALFKLCRKQGIVEFNMQDLKIRFGDLPDKHTQDEGGDEEIPTDELTTDQLIYFSAGGR